MLLTVPGKIRINRLLSLLLVSYRASLLNSFTSPFVRVSLPYASTNGPKQATYSIVLGVTFTYCFNEKIYRQRHVEQLLLQRSRYYPRN